MGNTNKIVLETYSMRGNLLAIVMITKYKWKLQSK